MVSSLIIRICVDVWYGWDAGRFGPAEGDSLRKRPSPRFGAAVLLDLLDGHDEDTADDGQCDGDREREVVAQCHDDGGHDDRTAHLAEGGGHVQDAQILAGLFLVR